MLEAMLTELDYLIAKYSSGDWISNPNAVCLVELITWHHGLILSELSELRRGRRKLTAKDFLGPEEREKLRLESKEGSAADGTPKKPNLKYFDNMEKEHMALKRRSARQAQRERKIKRMEERKAERKALRKKEKAS
jgi:hypothetical protein